MSYKLGLLLSLAFLMSILLLSGDLLNVNIVKNSLDSLATTVSYRIARDGRISEYTRKLVSSYKATLTVEGGSATSFRIGDTVIYYLSKDYDPFLLKKETMHIGVKRSAVVGYYKD